MPGPFPIEPIAPDRLDLLLPDLLVSEEVRSVQNDAGLFLDDRSVNFIRQARPELLPLGDPVRMLFVQEVHVHNHQVAAREADQERIWRRSYRT